MLFDQIYPNSDFAESLDKMGISMDGTTILPWAGDGHSIMDADGNILGFIETAENNGINFYDSNMNQLGWTMESAAGTSEFYSADNTHIGFSRENVFGGVDQYDGEGNLETFSQENIMGGTDTYSPDMEMLHSSEAIEHPSGMMYSIETEVPEVDVGFEGMDFVDFNGAENTSEIMSLFDLF
ncbi:hypothetical protein [Salinicoccus luteus]|uniref:hypothetical protein n=1 Tax=Salinicoccus luteus TaxID=367840 RepID=UPI0004E0B27D|nr:hypothetical protein [Salinicoccus luteus]